MKSATVLMIFKSGKASDRLTSYSLHSYFLSYFVKYCTQSKKLNILKAYRYVKRSQYNPKYSIDLEILSYWVNQIAITILIVDTLDPIFLNLAFQSSINLGSWRGSPLNDLY